MKVFKECCKNCLLSPNKIVSGEAAKDIVQNCVQKQTHFICHKASMNGEEITCKNFFDRLGHHSQMVRIAERLNVVRFVPQTDTEKLPAWTEMEPTPKTK